MNQIDVRRIRTLSREYVCSTKIYYFFYPEAERPKPVESSKPPDSSSLAIMDLQYLSDTCQMYSNVWSNWPDYSDQIIQPLFSRCKDLIHDGKQKTIRVAKAGNEFFEYLSFLECWNARTMPVPWLLLWVRVSWGSVNHQYVFDVLLFIRFEKLRRRGANAFIWCPKKWQWECSPDLVRISSEALHNWLVMSQNVSTKGALAGFQSTCNLCLKLFQGFRACWTKYTVEFSPCQVALGDSLDKVAKLLECLPPLSWRYWILVDN